jgi:separase
MSEMEELSISTLVSESLGEVVQMAQFKSSFVEGKSFALLCVAWSHVCYQSDIYDIPAGSVSQFD